MEVCFLELEFWTPFCLNLKTLFSWFGNLLPQTSHLTPTGTCTKVFDISFSLYITLECLTIFNLRMILLRAFYLKVVVTREKKNFCSCNSCAKAIDNSTQDIAVLRSYHGRKADWPCNCHFCFRSFHIVWLVFFLHLTSLWNVHLCLFFLLVSSLLSIVLWVFVVTFIL